MLYFHPTRESMMDDRAEPRKRSPRAPIIALDEALERTLKIYEKDRVHPIPTDIAARHMGYAGANNGAALQCLASLRYYGLLVRPKDGLVAVSKDVEAYKFAPSEDLRKAFLRRFLSAPSLFADLLDRAQGGMPSDEALRYELIQRGFIPGSAAIVAAAFKRSVEFADALNADALNGDAPVPPSLAPAEVDASIDDIQEVSAARSQPAESSRAPSSAPVSTAPDDADNDRIPVRLSGGRRAWIVVPALFYAKDKERLKAQIDLLLTQDEEEDR
jgi:hypothetical protein